jgi:hypothetical protein
MISRRAFLATATGGLMIAPLAAAAQQAGRTSGGFCKRIGRSGGLDDPDLAA